MQNLQTIYQPSTLQNMYSSGGLQNMQFGQSVQYSQNLDFLQNMATVVPAPAAPVAPVSPAASATTPSMMKMILNYFKKDLKTPNGQVFEKDALAFAKANAATVADLEVHQKSLMSNEWFSNLATIVGGSDGLVAMFMKVL